MIEMVRRAEADLAAAAVPHDGIWNGNGFVQVWCDGMKGHQHPIQGPPQVAAALRAAGWQDVRPRFGVVFAKTI